MLNLIRSRDPLTPHLVSEISDEGIEVSIDSQLSTDDYVAIKVDNYYASLHQQNTPKSIDFIVVVDGSCSSYALYLLELKNVNCPRHLNLADIKEKFSTTINDFLGSRFSDIFENDRFKYKLIKLYLISDAYKAADHFPNHQTYLEFRKKIAKQDSLKVELSLGDKLYKFRGRILKIEYDIPPNPVIKKP